MSDKIVKFNDWCPKCKHFSKSEWDDPCNECLAQGGNEDSTKPICYEEEKR